MQNKGFTLLELLVVVLIIGVLTAIAVPRYHLAVAKTKIIGMVMFADRLHEEQKTYRLTYGQYADNLAKLDLEGMDCSSGTCYFGQYYATVGSSDFSQSYWLGVYLKGVLGSKFPHIETYGTKRYECLTSGYENNAEICKIFGGRTRPGNANYYYMDNL